MAVDGSVPPPPPARQQQQQQRSPRGAQPPPPPPPTAVVLGGATAPAAERKRPATTGAASENASSSPPPSTAGPSKGSYPPKAWALLALPSVEKALGATAGATAAGAGPGADVTVDGVSAADLAPYGEADLSMALTAPPERLRRLAAEADPFDDRFLVPVGVARRVREAVARLVSLADASGPEGRILEVCVYQCV